MNLSEKKYESGQEKEWEAFCGTSPDAWFWHTSGWLEYTLNYRPELKSKGNAAMYGMMAKVPLRFMVKSAVHKVLEGMYAPGGDAPDLTKPPVDGLVGQLLERHGDKVQAALDRVDAIRQTARKYL